MSNGNNDNKKKNYEIVQGNIKDLDLSDVSEHITPAKPKKKNIPNNIIIPESKEKNNK